MSFSSMMVDVVSQAIGQEVSADDFQEFQAAADADLQNHQTAPDGWESVGTDCPIVPGEAYQELAADDQAAEIQEAAPEEKPPQKARFTAPRKELAELGFSRRAIKAAADHAERGE